MFKAIIAVCRMLITAIWNVLSKLEPYSAKGYLEDKLTEHSVVISKAQGLELLRKRGYIFKDELAVETGSLASAVLRSSAGDLCPSIFFERISKIKITGLPQILCKPLTRSKIGSYFQGAVSK